MNKSLRILLTLALILPLAVSRNCYAESVEEAEAAYVKSNLARYEIRDRKYRDPLPITQYALEDARTAYKKGPYYDEAYPLAYRLFRSLAEQGNPLAQFTVAVMLMRGHAVSKDYTEALTWFRKAAEQSFNPNEATLQPGEFRDAANWYKRASEQGKPNARPWPPAPPAEYPPISIAEMKSIQAQALDAWKRNDSLASATPVSGFAELQFGDSLENVYQKLGSRCQEPLRATNHGEEERSGLTLTSCRGTPMTLLDDQFSLTLYSRSSLLSESLAGIDLSTLSQDRRGTAFDELFPSLVQKYGKPIDIVFRSETLRYYFANYQIAIEVSPSHLPSLSYFDEAQGKFIRNYINQRRSIEVAQEKNREADLKKNYGTNSL